MSRVMKQNEGTTETEYKTGDWVWVKKQAWTGGLKEKMKPKYKGPWEVVERYRGDTSTYILKNDDGERVLFNVEMLKRYTPPQGYSDDDDEDDDEESVGQLIRNEYQHNNDEDSTTTRQLRNRWADYSSDDEDASGIGEAKE